MGRRVKRTQPQRTRVAVSKIVFPVPVNSPMTVRGVIVPGVGYVPIALKKIRCGSRAVSPQIDLSALTITLE